MSMSLEDIIFVVNFPTKNTPHSGDFDQGFDQGFKGKTKPHKVF